MPHDGDREQVFCHLCRHVWYRDEHGIICPDCDSDVVEIIEPQSDPRQIEEQEAFSSHPLQDHDPWHDTVPEEDDNQINSRSMGGTLAHRPQEGALSTFPGMHPFEALFGSMLGGGMQTQPQATRSSGWTTRTSGGRLPGGGSYSFSVASGPSWNMQYRSGSSIGMNPGLSPGMLPDMNRGMNHSMQSDMNHGISPGINRGDTDDLSGIFSNLLQFIASPNSPLNNRGTTMPNTMHPLLSLMMAPLNGNHGDAVYTQEGFDRILTMLRDQHGGAGGAPPASEEAIAALPTLRISREHLDEQGKAECSICMDQVAIGEEVTELPCNHWFHGSCIKSWLVEHDTCPQCRRGITPREGPQNQPRATGQAPQYWQVNRDDLEDYVGSNSRSSTGFPNTVPSSNTSRNPESPSRSQSTRSSLTNMANNIMRRISGTGQGQSDNNNDPAGSGHPRHNSRSS